MCLWLSPTSLRPLLLFLPVSFFGDPPEVEEALRLKLLLSCHLMMDQPLDHLPTLLGPNTPLFSETFLLHSGKGISSKNIQADSFTRDR